MEVSAATGIPFQALLDGPDLLDTYIDVINKRGGRGG